MTHTAKLLDRRTEAQSHVELLTWLFDVKRYQLCVIAGRSHVRWTPVSATAEELVAEYHNTEVEQLESGKTDARNRSEEDQLRLGPVSVWLEDNASRPLYEQYERALDFEEHLGTAHAEITKQLQERRNPTASESPDEFDRWRASADYARRLTARKLDVIAAERARLTRLAGPNASIETVFVSMARATLSPDRYRDIMTQAVEFVRRERKPR